MNRNRAGSAWPEPPPSPPRSAWAVVVAAWVSCWRRSRRLAQAGCSCVCAVAAPDGLACGTLTAAPAPPSAAAPFQPARKGAAMRCPAAEARDAAPRPAACAPVLATLPRPAIALRRRQRRRNRPETPTSRCWPSRRRHARAAGKLGGGRRHARTSSHGATHARRGSADGNAAPAAPTAAPAIAPAPSCGAPETRPVAMPGPKIPSASKVSEASMMTSAWSIDGSAGWTWN